jgi:hypothetical protein
MSDTDEFAGFIRFVLTHYCDIPKSIDCGFVCERGRVTCFLAERYRGTDIAYTMVFSEEAFVMLGTIEAAISYITWRLGDVLAKIDAEKKAHDERRRMAGPRRRSGRNPKRCQQWESPPA